MSRAPALLAVLAVLAGCGGDDERRAEPSPANDRRAIAQRVTRYVEAVVRGEGETVCRQLTPAFRRALERQARTHGYEGCADVFQNRARTLAAQLGGKDRERLFAGRRVYIELRHDVATAGLEPARSGRVPKRVTLVRAGGEWRINALGTRPL